MSTLKSMTSPYATMADLPHYEKRADAVLAPWLKDEPAVLSGRSHDPDAFMACNSQTAPYATFHNVPRHYETIDDIDLKAHRYWPGHQGDILLLTGFWIVWSVCHGRVFYRSLVHSLGFVSEGGHFVTSHIKYVGPLPEAPWDKEMQMHPSHRVQQPHGPQYHHTIPFGTSDNYEQPQQNGGVVADAPWDKNLPTHLPNRGSGGHEHSNLPSSQTAPYGTTTNYQEQKQYAGPMPDAPWDKDQRPLYQQKVQTEDYFTNVPYATSENMDHQVKVQSAIMTGRGHDHHDCGGSANSHTAPYATFDNRTTPKPNRTAGFQAPWDRDEVHYNRVCFIVQRNRGAALMTSDIVFHHHDEGLTYAPYATDPR